MSNRAEAASILHHCRPCIKNTNTTCGDSCVAVEKGSMQKMLYDNSSIAVEKGFK